MEFLFSLPAILIILFQPVLTAFAAYWYDRNPVKWLLIGLLLPFVATIIVLWLPESNRNRVRAVENDELF
ncbi:MAG: hypothetical protein H7Y31_11945, partial [Chitinophagaceae bacterium]|nr:hypothetical protein [Chitinophagaceae bacterium]